MPTATAAVLSANHAAFVLEDVEVESPQRGEVLVRIVATGLCHTDLSVREGLIPFPLPGVLGHEGAGVIEEVGDGVSDLEVGDHVVMSFAFCGGCRTCRTGHPVYCENWAGLNLFGGARADGTPTAHRDGQALHGHFFGQSSLATRALASAGSVIKVPRKAPLELLGPLACGVQTGAQSVLNVLRPEPGTTLAVFGAGGVGLSAVIAAVHLTGATVAVVDVNPARLELATRLGAAHVINAREQDPVAGLQEITAGRGNRPHAGSDRRPLRAALGDRLSRTARRLRHRRRACTGCGCINEHPHRDRQRQQRDRDQPGRLHTGGESRSQRSSNCTARAASRSTSSSAYIGSRTFNRPPKTLPTEPSSSPC
jgi:Zn-dependent alcohol dehydrogenase